MTEIIVCSTCKQEKELYYEDDIVVHETKCKCKPIDRFEGMKPVDWVIAKLKKERGLNEEFIFGVDSISKER